MLLFYFKDKINLRIRKNIGQKQGQLCPPRQVVQVMNGAMVIQPC